MNGGICSNKGGIRAQLNIDNKDRDITRAGRRPDLDLPAARSVDLPTFRNDQYV